MSEQNGSNPEEELHTSPEVKELEAILPDVPVEVIDRVLLWAARQMIYSRVDEDQKTSQVMEEGGIRTLQDARLYFIARIAILATQLDDLKDDHE